MRIIYTIGLIIGVPVLFICAIMTCVRLDEFLEQRFGKPPIILIIVMHLGWAALLVKAAWDQAGKWL